MKRYVSPKIQIITIGNESIMQGSGSIDSAPIGEGGHGVNASKGSAWDDEF